MRKTILDVLGIVVAISMCTATPVATASVNVNNYVDTNEYGICDNIADGNGCNYVDVNKDGVCDNIANGNGNCYGNGYGYNSNSQGGHHNQGGHGRCGR